MVERVQYAFPMVTSFHPQMGIQADPGMTLRDYFAGQAIIALTAGCPITDDDASWCHPLIAEDAYKLADAMLAVRTKQPDPTP
jgi:hypothetical protein